jgi:hypothetical protein
MWVSISDSTALAESVAANPGGQLGEAAYLREFRKSVGVHPSCALKTVEKC